MTDGKRYFIVNRKGELLAKDCWSFTDHIEEAKVYKLLSAAKEITTLLSANKRYADLIIMDEEGNEL